MFIDLGPEGLSKRDLLVRVLWRSDLSGRFKDSSGRKVRPALARRCIAQIAIALWYAKRWAKNL